jgi:transcriptional regulator with XRE-family HTH domain
MNDSPRPVKGPRKNLSQAPARLRRRRVAAGLTLRQAAEQAGCSYQHLSDLENGGHSARPSTLAALAGAYGCEIIDLMPPETAGKAA